MPWITLETRQLTVYYHEAIAVDLLCPVNVEEIGVQNGLDDTRNDGDWVVEPRYLEEISVDPIGNVQCPIGAECEQVMGCDCLRFASSLEHEELGQDGNRFEPDGERPKDLIRQQFVSWQARFYPTSEKLYL